MTADRDEAFYVAYGSNMRSSRFATYLTGGRPAGGARSYPGCRDATPPLARVPVWLPGSVYFAGISTVWGGGMAFYDPDRPGPTPGCGHRITVAQLGDVIAQEMHRDPYEAADADRLLTEALLEGRPGTRVRLGPGRYETVVVLDPIDGLPAVTFTSPRPHGAEDLNAPSEAYLQQLAAGLAEAHGWTQTDARAHFAALDRSRRNVNDVGPIRSP